MKIKLIACQANTISLSSPTPPPSTNFENYSLWGKRPLQGSDGRTTASHFVSQHVLTPLQNLFTTTLLQRLWMNVNGMWLQLVAFALGRNCCAPPAVVFCKFSIETKMMLVTDTKSFNQVLQHITRSRNNLSYFASSKMPFAKQGNCCTCAVLIYSSFLYTGTRSIS